MAACCQQPKVDYFKLTTRRPQNTTVSPSFAWESSPYSDTAPLSSDSCDSILTSPTSPESLLYPNPIYALPEDEEVTPESKSEQAFNFGTFEDWMRWDDPSDNALSPTSELFPEPKNEPTSPNMGGLNLQGGASNRNSINPSVISKAIDDSAAVFGEDPISEEPLFRTPSSILPPPLTTNLPREGPYSTPLSWSRPNTGVRLTQPYGALTPSQESKLRDIAMPSKQYPASPSSVSSPEPAHDNRRKRKSSVEEDDEDDFSSTGNGRHPPVKKTAHNMIEKRYRTNLNDKIAALRDSVPSLRVVTRKSSRGDEIQEDLQGLKPAHKLNKATVLSKATEYIAHLEKRNRHLAKENSNLKSRVDAFEILMSRANNKTQRTAPRPGSGRYGLDGLLG